MDAASRPTARRSLSLAALVAAATALLAAADTPSAPSAASAPQSAAERAAIESVVRDYLLRHPEIIVEALRALEEKARAERVRQVVAEEGAALYADGHSFIAGNPQGDVTLVEFYDYNCGYCRKVSADVRKLMSRDKALRVVFKEWPIRGEDSEAAARVSIAAARQPRFLDFHFALMAQTERATERLALEVARAAGLDMDKLKADMKAIDAAAVLEKNRALAEKLTLDGTPAFLVGDTLIPGAAPLKELAALIKEKRQQRAASN